MKKLFFILFFVLLYLSTFSQNKARTDTSIFDVNCAKPGQKIPQNCPISYDFDCRGLQIDCRPCLDSLVKLFKEHKGWKVEIASHTDCRSSLSYNDTLSQKRADTLASYFFKKGIPKKQIIAKGYGERKLRNNCKCEDGKGPGMDCTEAEHQINRRTEFVILENTEKCK